MIVAGRSRGPIGSSAACSTRHGESLLSCPAAGPSWDRAARTPAGEAAVVVHRGPYEKLAAVHQALRQWCAANGRTIGAPSLEIYGDWSDDPEKLETSIEYLLQ